MYHWLAVQQRYTAALGWLIGIPTGWAARDLHLLPLQPTAVSITAGLTHHTANRILRLGRRTAPLPAKIRTQSLDCMTSQPVATVQWRAAGYLRTRQAWQRLTQEIRRAGTAMPTYTTNRLAPLILLGKMVFQWYLCDLSKLRRLR